MSKNGGEGKDLFVTGVINLELWNEAKWNAAIIATNGEDPPVLGIGFTYETPARSIFEQWQEMFGQVDENEEIRVSIIEGDLINTNVDGLLKRTQSAGLDISKDYIVTLGRIHRMNPAPSSKNLENFKNEYSRMGAYFLAPAVYHKDGRVDLFMELSIIKREVIFRDVDGIGENDIDRLVFRKDE